MRTLLILAMLCPLLSPGQTSVNKTAPLTIGDTVPDIPLSGIINYKSSSVNLSALKGRLVIFDFFATWCSTCIKELPKLDSLQNQHGQNLQIFLVSREPLSKINGLRKKNSRFRACTLPLICADTLLNKLFPHKTIPHEVWINPSGAVAAITDASQITQANIMAVLSGRPVVLPLKQDVIDFQAATPFLQNRYIAPHLGYAAAFAPYIKNIGSTQGRSATLSAIRYYFINSPILALYQKAWGFAPNRVILNVKDPGRFTKTPQNIEAWKQANLCSYEITLPASAPRRLLDSILRADLDRFLNYRGSLQKRKTKCWALVCSGTPPPSGGRPPYNGPDDSDTAWLFTNQPLSALVQALNTEKAPVIIDETGHLNNLDIRLPLPALHSIPLLVRSLAPYGLTLIPVERDLEIFALSENNGNEQPNNTTTPAGNQTKLRQKAIEKDWKENAQTSKRPSTRNHKR